MPKLNLAAWVECTEVEGPGKRSALWVQGCLRRCPGCCNPHMQDIVPKQIVDVEAMVSRIRDAQEKHNIEGLTFAGGEPMLQARGLAHVARGCQEMGLSVIVFTGYTLDELKRAPLPGTPELLANTDLLLDGPYDSDLPETERNWVGSANQQIHFLTDRYSPGIECDRSLQHDVELRIGGNQEVSMNGWPVAFGRSECRTRADSHPSYAPHDVSPPVFRSLTSREMS